jgi:hypothetical protein
VGINPTQVLAARRDIAGHSWPFMAARSTHGSQLTPEGVGVPTHQEVTFKDGHSIWLTRVIKDGSPHLFLRDLGEPAAGKQIDLRVFIPECEKELPTTNTRDVAGFILFGLRCQFETRDAFLHAVEIRKAQP